LLYARIGEPQCPEHGVSLAAQSIAQMVDHVMQLPEDTRLMILAPVINDRKGEQTSLIDELRAQGFVRIRIDGIVHDIDALPTLKKNTKHTIDVVVDRVKIRPDIRQRIAESFETALRHGNGRALAIEMDADQTLTFSARLSCPTCGYASPELEPRLFSFNNPAGACQRCDGLGVINFFDPERIAAFPDMSLAAGAIKGWDSRNQFYFQMLLDLATHYGFDIETPFNQLPEAARHAVLHGSGKTLIRFTYVGEQGKTQIREHAFEGVIPNLERRHRETDSPVVRDELAKYLNTQACVECKGTRLRTEARNVMVSGQPIFTISALQLGKAMRFFETMTLSGAKQAIAEKISGEIRNRLRFLVDVGLGYLSLDRPADTLSGGESQRIRLASQIGSGLTGVMYVLDEPSIGLHQRDNTRLLDMLKRLRDIGNSVIVVEHDQDAIMAADHVVDMGLGAGEHGGEIIAQGTPTEIISHANSLTGQYLSGRRRIDVPAIRHRMNPERQLVINGAHGNNLKHVSIAIPVGLFTCVTGVSGSGKSTLVNDTLYRAIARDLYGSSTEPAPFDEIIGSEFFDKVVNVDQSPIGRTPRSNPATYTGLFTPIRELFAGVPEARARGYGSGRFSFNVKGGRCESCQGDGVLKVEMHFLPDIYVSCDVCHGKRYNQETLDIRYKGRTINEVLAMTVEQAVEFFNSVPTIARKLQTMLDVGLGYITLGQSATTLSGGEAQRVKLSLELSKRDTGRTLYILDEPTTGLHFHDIDLLLHVLHRLRDHGNTIVVIEHNLDVIKTADWVIDLGPEGGDGGGQIVVAGPPEVIAEHPLSQTGYYLKSVLI
jgi:excinuclease ABC subunit A